MTQESTITRAEVLDTMQTGWRAFNAYLDTLTEAQASQLTDAAGWTIKDHVIHLAVWEDSMNALFEYRNRADAMGVDRATYQSGDWDKMNAVIQQRCQPMTWAEVRATFQAVHERLIAKLQTLPDADLQRPYNEYQPDSTGKQPAITTLIGNTSAHYAEHRPWIEAIAASGS